jgi:hypothetical protein
MKLLAVKPGEEVIETLTRRAADEALPRVPSCH